MLVAEKIREQFKEGETMEQFAKRSGIHQSALSRIMSGKQRITTAIACQLHGATGIDALEWIHVQAKQELAEMEAKK